MANAETQQQFLDMYAGQSAEMQQRMYNAGNAEVKAIIDRYNASQNTQNTQDTPTPTQTTTINTPTETPDPNRTKFNYTDSDYYTLNSQARQDDIVNNLNNYWKNSPNLFTNYNAFKNNFSYNDRSDQQKKTLDDWRFGYDNSRQLYTKPTSDLTTLYKNGQLSDADLNNLKYFYPDKYNDVMNKINGQNDMQQYSEMLYGPEDTLDTSNVFNQLGNQFLNNLLTNGYSSSIDYFEQYQNELNTDEMRGWSDRLTDLQTEIDKIDTDLNTLYKDIEKRYEGTGASTAKIQAVYADEAYDLQIQRNSLALEQQSLATKYNSRLQEAQNNFSMRVQQHQLEMQEKNQYMNELGFAMDLINFETNEEADERAWKNWTRQIDYQYGNIDSLDPVARRKAVDNSVSQILDQYDGIPMKRSKDQMVEDVLKLVDSGMSLGEALTQNIITPIKSKPEYITWYNSKLGVNSPVQYQMDANGNLSLVGGTATVPIGTTGNNYQSIDLGNGYSVKVDGNKPITINGQQYRITQLGGETATSGIDFAPLKAGTNQEVQAFMGGTVIRSGEDRNSDNGHGNNRYVEVLCDNGYVYRYNHLKDWDGDVYATGQRVEAGDVLGHMGETGKAYGVHLDLAVYDGSRANSMAVSPLNIVDQAKVFFNSVNAQGLGIGSVGTNNIVSSGSIDFSGLTDEQITEVTDIMVERYGKNFAAKATEQTIAAFNSVVNQVRAGKTKDDIFDYLREQGVSEKLKNEKALYNAATSAFTDLYGTNQTKEFNFIEQLEKYVEDDDYDNAFEYVLKQIGGATSQSVTSNMKSDIEALRKTVGVMQDISDLYDQFLSAGGKTKDLKEMYQAAVDELPYSWEASGELREIGTRMQLALADYIAFKSGKTVSEQEYSRYAAIFPTDLFKNSSTKTKNQINSLLNAVEDGLNINYRNALTPKQYNALQDWYKSKVGHYYSFRNALGNYTTYDDTYDIFSDDMIN